MGAVLVFLSPLSLSHLSLLGNCTGNPRVFRRIPVPIPARTRTRDPHGFTRQNESENSQKRLRNEWVTANFDEFHEIGHNSFNSGSKNMFLGSFWRSRVWELLPIPVPVSTLTRDPYGYVEPVHFPSHYHGLAFSCSCSCLCSLWALLVLLWVFYL